MKRRIAPAHAFALRLAAQYLFYALDSGAAREGFSPGQVWYFTAIAVSGSLRWLGESGTTSLFDYPVWTPFLRSRSRPSDPNESLVQRRLRDSKKRTGDQVAEEDAGGDDDGVHEPVEGRVLGHNAWVKWLRGHCTDGA